MTYLYQLDVIERFIISIGGGEGVIFLNQIDDYGNRLIPDLMKKEKSEWNNWFGHRDIDTKTQ